MEPEAELQAPCRPRRCPAGRVNSGQVSTTPRGRGSCPGRALTHTPQRASELVIGGMGFSTAEIKPRGPLPRAWGKGDVLELTSLRCSLDMTVTTQTPHLS